jgi:UV DNA damage repair endonuclease
MFNQHPRVGFACKIQKAQGIAEPNLSTKATTITWLQRQTKDQAYTRLYELAKHNLQALRGQLEYISKLPPNRRMFRMSSDILTAYTHEDYSWCYQELDMQNLLEREFAKLGEFSRQHDIRLSFHPGQFCVLASESAITRENSIYEFEYHIDIIRWMGFGKEFQDFKCNVHIGGKLGPDGIKQAVKHLSKEARNCLTIENAEFTWGLQHSLELVDTCALVLDIHHHFIMTGEYIDPSDWRITKLQDSWRGCRPVVHFSVSRPEVLAGLYTETRPDLKDCLSRGITKAKLRAHSDFYWNPECNKWAAEHLSWADLMLEAKEKNLAADEFCKAINF